MPSQLLRSLMMYLVHIIHFFLLANSYCSSLTYIHTTPQCPTCFGTRSPILDTRIRKFIPRTNTFVSTYENKNIRTVLRSTASHDSSKKDPPGNREQKNPGSDPNSNYQAHHPQQEHHPLQQQQQQQHIFQDDECFDLCETNENDSEDMASNVDSTIRSSSFSDHVNTETTHSSATNSHIQKKANNTMSPQNMMKNIELRWSIEESNHDCDVDDLQSCSEPCGHCQGHGTLECTFCQGLGYIDMGPQDPGTMGDLLIRQNGGRTGIECPVCNEDGDQVCSNCRGSGWIAKWRLNLTDLKP